ncbi:MAG: ThiF family adenylyltransferase [Stenomitos rutilans HA7619-LM2]|jgi:PRTRC genetic system ThiF family protein|nr:ThiF family adenylyltransferase [Stenomitos rutilans HA7619-LM2]
MPFTDSLLNYEVIHARPIVVPPTEAIEFWVVGCGGTGSFLVQLLCRVLQHLIQQGKRASLVLVDPDHVEAKNLTRQCFCPAEVGLNKAETLAARYGIAFGLPIRSIAQPFKPDMIARNYNTLTVLMGCVDNAKARASLAKALEFNYDRSLRVWWIDGGNGNRFGQVLIGSSLSNVPKDYEFSELGCICLPAPSVQAPELLISKPEEHSDKRLSCAELMLLNAQGLMVNPQTAVLMAEIALELVSGYLKRFAVCFDQTSGAMTSKYTTQAAIMRVLREHGLGTVYQRTDP